MKRRFISLITALAIFLALAAPAMAAPAVTIKLDGNVLPMNPQPYVRGGVTMVPLRALCEAMGYTVQWQGSHGIRVSLEQKKLGIRADLRQEGKDFYFKRDNRASVRLTTAPTLVDGHTFVPLRTLAEMLDYQVTWDAATATVSLTDGRKIPMLDGLRADTAFSLLEDRLQISLPAAFTDEAAQMGGIMGFGMDARAQTNLVLVKNGQTFTVTARELYALSAGDLGLDLQYLHSQDFSALRITEPVTAGEIGYLTYTPQRYDEAQGGLLMGALVRTSEGALIDVSVHADRFAMAFANQCQTLAQEILRSLRAGSRLLTAQPQTLRVGLYQMELSSGYVFNRNIGPDFDVFHVYQLAAVNQPVSNFGIYLGSFPAAAPSATAQPVQDTALGAPITWRLYAKTPGQFDQDTYAETVIKTAAGTYLHVFATPVTAADWEAIRAMVRTLR